MRKYRKKITAFAGHMLQESKKMSTERWKGIAIVGALMLLLMVTLYVPGHMQDMISVSNSVDGRELPIYCVQTEKPEIALTFDAAWGNTK